MPQTLLVTGGAGFIGSNFIRYILGNSESRIICLDALTYAGNIRNLDDVRSKSNYFFVHGSIQNKELVKYLCKTHKIDGILNFAAESHVDRSILGADVFIDTNVKGTLVLLEVAKELRISRFLQVSTDEVYGSLGFDGSKFTEETPLAANSPYSASKASADLLVRSFVHTHGIPAVITRCSNNYGPFQFPEKLVPLMILNAIEDNPLPVYGDGMNVRDWIHVLDHCSAIWEVFQHGRNGEVYNIGGNCEKPNIEVVKTILSLVGKSETLINYVKDRPGHDRRYAIDSTKMLDELGWSPKYDFETGLADTVRWFKENSTWCESVRSMEYLTYYEKQYGNS